MQKPRIKEDPLVAFFRGTGFDDECRTLEQILTWDDQLMEVCHDYIQWLFPTDEPSRFNQDAPILGKDAQETFKEDETIQRNMRRALRHFLAFLGLHFEDAPVQVEKAENFGKRVLMCWRGPRNHNWKRIARVLKCLHLAGLTSEHRAFAVCLEEIIRENPDMIEEETVAIWRERGVGAQDDHSSHDGTPVAKARKRKKTARVADLPGGSVRQLRDYFANVAEEHLGAVKKHEFLSHVRGLAEKRHGGALEMDLLEMFEAAVSRLFYEVDVGVSGTVDVNEWSHFIMLQNAAPSAVAAHLLNTRLRQALQEQPTLLERILASFEAHDKDHDGRLTKDHWKAAFADVRHEHITPVGEIADQVGYLNYFEFVSHVVGVGPTPVEVAVYDASSWLAQRIADEGFNCKCIEGFTHTGVRAFGTEYWFGGGIFLSDVMDGATPFGKPVRVESMGFTMRTQEELQEFLHKDLLQVFNQSTYEVFERDGNCFANEVLQFLRNGKQLPRELLERPAWADAGLAPGLRAAMNQALSSHGDLTDHTQRATEISDDHTAAWRLTIKAGDLVLHRGCFVDLPQVARIVSIIGRPDLERKANLITLGPEHIDKDPDAPPWRFVVELLEWAPTELSDVPVRALWPCSGSVPGYAM